MGTPGSVLAAVLPDTAVTLVEKNPVRCAFLERAAHSMGLRNVAVVEASVPEWTAGYAAFDLVTSRAAAAPGELLAWAAPLRARRLVRRLGRGRARRRVRPGRRGRDRHARPGPRRWSTRRRSSTGGSAS